MEEGMRFYFDTEFIDDGRVIDLISIGIVSEDGREYYAESCEVNLAMANQFVREHVLPKLSGVTSSLRVIADDIRAFVGDKPEFWGYYADYDWVALCHLYGAMVDLPKTWPFYCRDLKQWCDALGNPPLPPEGKNEHNALTDAWWNKVAYEYLCGIDAFQQNLVEKNTVLVERSVGAMAIAEGEEDWEKVPITCPMLDAVAKLRRERDSFSRTLYGKVVR
jgi:3' exoribonuclease, RNase T-like